MAYTSLPASITDVPSPTKAPSSITDIPSITDVPAKHSGAAAPATPTLTTPSSSVALFNGVATTLAASTTDTNLDQMDWLIDGSVVATVVGVGTPAGTYSTSYTPSAVTDGDRTLTCRATRSGQTATSAGRTINMGEKLWTLVSSVTCLRAWQSDFGVHDDGSAHCDSWTDQKNSTTATQATAANRPTIATGVHFHPVLSFDGTNDVLREGTLDLPAPGTTPTFVWSVIKQTTYSAGTIISCSGTTLGSTRLAQAGAGSGQVFQFNAAAVNVTNGTTLGTIARIEQLYNNNLTDYVKVAATSVTGANAGNSDPAAGWCMGGLSNSTSCSGHDRYAELVFSGLPNGTELAALSAAAAAMYGAAV